MSEPLSCATNCYTHYTHYTETQKSAIVTTFARGQDSTSTVLLLLQPLLEYSYTTTPLPEVPDSALWGTNLPLGHPLPTNSANEVIANLPTNLLQEVESLKKVESGDSKKPSLIPLQAAPPTPTIFSPRAPYCPYRHFRLYPSV
ncbi:hypothetical protein V493_02266 [Pseudogymnoascus sp. VKM F-4281 (FW-2241)]|nr:hypothetical protein V493_02266 [Pseudogymnoascus sp. VKM F-4281 (FW-2241)]